MSKQNERPKTRREKIRDIGIRVLCVFCRENPVGSCGDDFEEWCTVCTPVRLPEMEYVTRRMARGIAINTSISEGEIYEDALTRGLIELHNFEPIAETVQGEAPVIGFGPR